MNNSQDETNEMQTDNPTPESSVSDLMSYVEDTTPAGGSLTAEEIDTLGEVGNICMGAVATTMYSLLDRRVEITTPRVAVLTLNDALKRFPAPLVVVEVEYIEGILGKNMLLLDEVDAALITDILMGGEGVVEKPIELSDLHMSAINEIMNQLTGASATALSQLLDRTIRISPPESHRTTLDETNTMALGSDDLVIVITFDMEIENLLNSQIIQVIPYDVGLDLSDLLSSANKQPSADSAPPPMAASPAPPAWADSDSFNPAPPASTAFSDPLPSFDAPSAPVFVPDSLQLIQDIPVQVSVELGRTKKEISEILDFDSGTVIVLDKAAGDPVEIYVNGKLVASGEVVVIDENYGVRITALYS